MQRTRNYSFLSGVTFQKSPQDIRPLYFESTKSSWWLWWKRHEITDEGKCVSDGKYVSWNGMPGEHLVSLYLEWTSVSLVNRLHLLTQPNLSLHLNEGENTEVPPQESLISCLGFGLGFGIFLSSPSDFNMHSRLRRPV